MKPIYQISICFFIFVKITLAQDGWFWQYPKPQGNTLHDIFIFDQNTAIAVGDLGKTTDGGESWDVQHHAGGMTGSLGNVTSFFLYVISGRYHDDTAIFAAKLGAVFATG